MLLAAGADPNAWVESGAAPRHNASDDVMKSLMYRYGAESKSAADFVLDDNIDALAVLMNDGGEEPVTGEMMVMHGFVGTQHPPWACTTCPASRCAAVPHPPQPALPRLTRRSRRTELAPLPVLHGC